MQKPGPDSALPWQQKGLQGLSPWSLNLKTWHTCPRKGLPSTWLLELLWGRIEVENQRCGLLFLFVCCFANDKWEKVLPEAQASPDPKGAVQRMKPKAAPVQHCQDSSGLCTAKTAVVYVLFPHRAPYVILEATQPSTLMVPGPGPHLTSFASSCPRQEALRWPRKIISCPLNGSY